MDRLSSELTLGILGGGQLGRMSAMAAARLGISVVIFCPEEDCPASYVSKETIIAPYDDEAALKKFSDKCDFISYEFENIPVKTIEYLNSLKPDTVLPDKKLLHVSQDRVAEKTFLNEHGIKTTRWASISNLGGIESTLKQWGGAEFILKTTRFGYDGKGQIKSSLNDDALSDFLEETTGQDLIMEELVDFSCEASVIIARDIEGNSETYGAMLNEHKNHILHKTSVPAGLSKSIEDKMIEIATNIAESINLTGVLTVEFFICKDGSVLVNEIAPRTHNSGHWSIDACCVSQFENHVRTVCGLAVGGAARHSDAVMINLIGYDVNNINALLDAPNACLHLYGKKQARDGRKMGHITFLKGNLNNE